MRKDEEKTYLQSAAVATTTASSYQKDVERFIQWAGGSVPSEDAQAMGWLLAEFLDELFFQGEQLAVGTKMLAAILHEWPRLGRGVRNSLPLARQALQGWKRLNPSRARLPLHWRIAFSIADLMLDKEEPWGALGVVVAFHGTFGRAWQRTCASPSSRRRCESGGARTRRARTAAGQ